MDPLFAQMQSHYNRQALDLGRIEPPPRQNAESVVVEEIENTGFSDSFGRLIYPKDIISHGESVGFVFKFKEKWSVCWDLTAETPLGDAELKKVVDKKRTKTKVIGKLYVEF